MIPEVSLVIPEVSLPADPWMLTQLVVAVSAVGEVVRRQSRIDLDTIKTAMGDARIGLSRRARAAKARVDQSRTPGDEPSLDGRTPGTVAPDPPPGSIQRDDGDSDDAPDLFDSESVEHDGDDEVDLIEDSVSVEHDSDDSREFVDLADEIDRDTDRFTSVSPGPSDASEFHSDPVTERYAEFVIRDGSVYEVVSDDGSRVCLEPRAAEDLPDPVVDDLQFADGSQVVRIETATLD